MSAADLLPPGPVLLAVALSAAAALLASAAAAGLAVRWNRMRDLVYPLCALLAGLLGLVGLLALLRGDAATLVLPLGLPWVGSHFRLDPLSAVFLAIVGFGGFAASLFAVGYGRHEPAPGRVAPFFPAFLAGMALVVLADDAFTFLFAWEFMSLTSWALVMAHHREPGTTFAGFVYFVMAAFGTLALLLAFGLMAGPQGHYAFEAMRSGPHRLAGVVMILALLGAGSKAGLVPLHVWLPLAHPAAPSHVSALMSGVMTKVAIYGFIRIAFDLVGPPHWWWSVVVLVVASITAVLGLLYAVLQEDLKRLLAYSTVENVGIVFLGLSLALAFKANGMAAAAALAMTAALLHAVNHAVFKSLLFFGAGSVLAATGQRSLDRLGGLIRLMPATSALFLVGAASISALPPLNGFVSEWLTFQAVLVSPQLPQWALKFLTPAAGAMLALAAALAAACFVRAYGIAFLGRPRSPEATAAHEADGFQIGAMALLAAACVGIGVLPGPVIDALAPAVRHAVGGAGLAAQGGRAWMTLAPISDNRSSYSGALVLLFVAASAVISAALVRAVASRAVRRAPAWDCGFPNRRPATQYSASGFAQPLRRVFGSVVFRAREAVEMPPPGDPGPARFAVSLVDPVWDGLYAPVARAVDRAAERLNRLQFLTIRQYLTLVFAALVLLLSLLTVLR